MAEMEKTYASKGMAGSALGLAIPGTIALANQLFSGGGGLGGLFGGGNNGAPTAACAATFESKETACLREKINFLEAQNMSREAGTKAFTDSATYATGLVDKLSQTVIKLTDGFIAQDREMAVLKSDIRCLAAVNDKDHQIITSGYQSAVQLESERRRCGDENLYSYVNATFVPGKLIMPLSSICPPAKPLHGEGNQA